jgi:hypothetical protein
MSARWRPVAAAAAAATALLAVGGALQPTLKLQDENYTVPNPIGLTAIPDEESGLLGAVLFGVLACCAIAALVSLVLRFRRSRGVERQQLKWFTYAAALAILFQVPSFQRPGAVYEVLFGLTFAFIPVAAGLAVLRDRLYDIDRLIDRTLVYGLLSVLLALVSAGGVFILGPLLNPAGGESALAIAASTLAVAALFQPLRRRVQTAVDRRFNRRRDNAAKTVEAFSGRLRYTGQRPDGVES